MKTKWHAIWIISGLFIQAISATILVYAVPNYQTEVVQKVEKKIIKVHKIVIPKPSNITYPSLKDPKDACHGAPVEIVYMNVAAAMGDDDKNVSTWFTVRPVSDGYTVQCVMGGDYSNMWNVGDVVSMPAGKLASGN